MECAWFTLEHNDQHALWGRTVETVVWLSTSYQTTRAAPHTLFMSDCDQQIARDCASTEVTNTELLN